VMVCVLAPLTLPEGAAGTKLRNDPPNVTDADQLNVLPAGPVSEIVTVWSAGLDPPCTAVKVSDVGDNPIVGAGGVTVKVTGMSCGVFVAPVAVTRIVPLYVPAVRLPKVIRAVNVCVLAPLTLPEGDAGTRLRKALPSVTDADQLSVLPAGPLSEMVTVWSAGLVPPWTAEKLNDVEDKPMVGGGGDTVNVTAMSCGVFVAPVAVTLMFPVYVPAVRDPKVTFAVMVWVVDPVMLPEVGATRLKNVAPLVTDADQLSVPDPVLEMVTVLSAGLEPPCTAEKLRDVGAKPMVGPAGVVPIVRLKSLLKKVLVESWAWTVKVNVPVEEVVPLIAPEELSVMPEGKLPEKRAQLL
jgi:hypothetical protein